MRKTKIICTMGPAVDDEEKLRALMLTGMDAARFNFSHGTHESHLALLNKVKRVRDELGAAVATILDTKGPEIRVKTFEEGPVTLAEGAAFTLTTRDVPGNADIVSVTYANLHNELTPGCRVLIDDGLIELKVEEISGQDIKCTVMCGGPLSSNKSINIPDAHIQLPALTEKDREDLRFAVEQDFDFVAASFVRKAADVEDIRACLREYGGEHIRIISKIENSEGVENLDEIIAASDGLMVARGDLGVEIPAYEVPVLQKTMIKKTSMAGKPVITATQMLDSMIRNPRPTRAEVTDVANAIYDGTDCVMLSGETAMGRYPVEALRTMVQIAESTEKHLDYEKILVKRSEFRKNDTATAVAYASVATAMHLNAKCIITPTMSGFTARIISQFRPETPVIATSPREAVLRRMQLYWGIQPIYSEEQMDTEVIISSSVTTAMLQGLVRPGDIVVMTAGLPAVNVQMGERGETNVMRVITVKAG